MVASANPVALPPVFLKQFNEFSSGHNLIYTFYAVCSIGIIHPAGSTGWNGKQKINCAVL
jgi:hypothetical protein